MRTELALREFIASPIAANLSLATSNGTALKDITRVSGTLNPSIGMRVENKRPELEGTIIEPSESRRVASRCPLILKV